MNIQLHTQKLEDTVTNAISCPHPKFHVTFHLLWHTFILHLALPLLRAWDLLQSPHFSLHKMEIEQAEKLAQPFEELKTIITVATESAYCSRTRISWSLSSFFLTASTEWTKFWTQCWPDPLPQEGSHQKENLCFVGLNKHGEFRISSFN